MVKTRIRRGFTFPRKITAFLLLCIILALAGYVLLFPSIKPRDITRLTVAVISEPMQVLSLDRESNEIRTITIPTDITVDAVHGYGRYSLEALWKLGSIEKKEGIVLIQSLEEAIGLPIPYYIGRYDHGYIKGVSSEEVLSEVFTLQGLIKYIRGDYLTNIPAREFMTLVRARSEALSSKHRIMDLTSSHVLVHETLPDGTTARVLDTQRLDTIVLADYEHIRIRDEQLSVSIFNTTNSPALGSRVARLLGHLGVRVVSVGNDSPAIEKCRVTGIKDVLQSFTAQVISRLYYCDLVPVEVSGQSDLDVRIGKVYLSRFLPFSK